MNKSSARKKVLAGPASVALVGLMLHRVAGYVEAQAAAPPPIMIRPVVGFSSMQEAIATLMTVIGFIGALLCFFYLVWGAYKYLAAGDNAANTAAARQTMLNAVIGLILLGMVYVIFNFFVSFIPGLSDWF